MLKRKKQSIRTIREQPNLHGRKVKMGRHLNINAPVSDFELSMCIRRGQYPKAGSKGPTAK